MSSPASFGCARCCGEDPSLAWEATRARPLQSLLQESHFGVQITACTCGQRFAVVFTERIDWRDGDDDQLWLVVPVTTADVDRLTACDDAQVGQVLTELARGRRFLVRSHPTGGSLSTWWRADGFAIGPHD